jgi:hypothetical protein
MGVTPTRSAGICRSRRASAVPKRKRAPTLGALSEIKNVCRSPKRRTGLDYSQIHPLTVDRLQLMHAAIVGVKEVTAIRDRMVMRGTDRTTRPTAATRSSPATAMFAGFFAEFDAVFHLVLDASKTSWNQPPISLELFFAHDLFDAETGQKVRRKAPTPQSGTMIFGTYLSIPLRL